MAYKIFGAICLGSVEQELAIYEIRSGGDIRIVERATTVLPLFSDTYKVDQHLITGPYLHNKTLFDGRITANDFFTYDINRKSRLYELVEAENKTLWDEATLQLNWERFAKAYRDIRSGDYRESEKVKLIYDACDPVAAPLPEKAEQGVLPRP